MATIKLFDNSEEGTNVYYEFDPETKPLGEGGMGKVFKGTRIDLNTGITRPVAIKFIFDGLAASVIERARREANIKIKHENLVEMMGFLTTENVNPRTGERVFHYHVVSELLDGVVLSDLLKGVVTDNEGKIIPFAEKMLNMYHTDPFAFAVMIVKNVLSGVMTLHDRGYIHRDIDPSNIMITRDNKIKLIDFGIAKLVKSLATQDRSLTAAGVFMGKIEYAAPELVLGDVKFQDETTDIYAIGIMFYQLLTGKMPFTGPKTEIMSAQLKKEVPVKNVDNKMARQIILKATNKKQELRYRGAAQFRAALDDLENNSGSSSLPVSLPVNFDRKNWRYIAAGAGALVLAALVWLLVSMLGGKKETTAGTEVNTNYQETGIPEDVKVTEAIILMKSATRYDYYALAKINDKYKVVKSQINYEPGDKQVDVVVSSDAAVNQLNKVDAIVEEIMSSSGSAKIVFLAQENLKSDPNMAEFDQKLGRFNLNITYYSPDDYPTQDDKMVVEFAKRNEK